MAAKGDGYMNNRTIFKGDGRESTQTAPRLVSPSPSMMERGKGGQESYGVALPLVAINAASARKKSIRHSHPSTLHLWWSRKPLATCRAVLFASLVDDPSEHPEEFPTEQAQEQERERLFRLIEELVKWENSNNEN